MLDYERRFLRRSARHRLMYLIATTSCALAYLALGWVLVLTGQLHPIVAAIFVVVANPLFLWSIALEYKLWKDGPPL